MPARPFRAPRRPFENARRNHRTLSLAAAAAAAAATTLLAPHPARAADRYWVSSTNLWTSNSWSTSLGGAAGASAPVNGDNAYVIFNDAIVRSVTFNSLTPTDALGGIQLDNTGAGTSLLSQSQGLLGGNYEYVGVSGNGGYSLGGGTNSVSTLYLGLNANGKGTYNLSGTGVLNASYEYVGYRGAGTFTQSGGTNSVSTTLEVGSFGNGTSPASSGTYTLSGGTVTSPSGIFGGQINVGNAGNGTFNQSGGAVTVFSLRAGTSYVVGGPATSGAYNLTGGVLTTATQTIGDLGTGHFLQNGGTNSTNTLILGGPAVPAANPTAAGDYTLQSGTLTAGGSATGQLTIGDSGVGRFFQTGGSATAGTVRLGHFANGTNAASSGSYALSGGTLLSSNLYVGDAGNGTFTHSGGTSTTNALYVGFAAGGGAPTAGTYALSNAGALTVRAQEYLGYDGVGTFNQTGGAHTVGDWLFLGYNAAGVGAYTLGGGALTSNSQSIGYRSTSASVFTQTGGVNNAPGFVTVGDQTGSRGVYNLQAGALTPYRLNVAWAGTGTVNQSGGTNTANGVFLGHETGGTGTYNLSGGTLNVGSIQPGEFDASTYVGYAGAGSFVQTGGTHTIAHSNSGGVYVGYFPGSTGSYRLDNGTLNVGANSDRTVVGYQGAGTFTQNGGAHLASNLSTGYVGTGVGTYTLNNGTLTVDQEFHGVFGNGTFTQNAGTHTANTLDVGRYSNPPGAGAPASGAFTLAGGSLAVYFSETIGHGGVGTFTQTGGANTLGDPGLTIFQLTIGADVTGVGSYTLSAGTLTVNGPETVGDYGAGTFTQTGGANTAAGALTIARQPAAPARTT